MLIDLHRHLEGSIRPGTALELADRDGHWLAHAGDPAAELTATGAGGGLLPYLARIETAASTARRAEDWQRIASEAVTDAADDGLSHLELRFSPRFIEAMTGVPAAAVIDAVADGVAAAARGPALTVGLIAIVVRDLGPVAGAGQMDLILARRDDFVAVDLAGDEAGFPPELFAPAFARARQAGLGVTIHAGEAAGPASVTAALDHLLPARIGHGVRSAEDPRLMERLARDGVTLEVALTSNVHTGAAPSLAGHQIRTLIAAGVPVTLNTDNPTVSQTTLSRELDGAARAAGLTPDETRAAADQAARAAFRPRLAADRRPPGQHDGDRDPQRGQSQRTGVAQRHAGGQGDGEGHAEQDRQHPGPDHHHRHQQARDQPGHRGPPARAPPD